MAVFVVDFDLLQHIKLPIYSEITAEKQNRNYEGNKIGLNEQLPNLKLLLLNP
jgi:hypothetical protein